LAISTFVSTAGILSSVLDTERVRRAVVRTRFTRIDQFGDVDSTNRVAREAAAAGEPEGLVVVAEHQTAGRGRRGRTWEAPEGTALLFSVLLRPALPPVDLHLVTAAVALAGRDACRAVAGVEAAVKWPNDLLVGDRKLAGILAEAAGGAVVVGMGLNVTSHPEGAASLAGAGWHTPDRDALLATLLVGLDGRLGRWPELRADYRAACATVGRRVRVEMPGGDLVGLAERVDEHGHLVVRPDGAVPVVVSAADVVHLRPV
jgi:BirA family biotin operon repressor/biotin-[acetyl-CoA-carboxylase] ligase